MSEFATIDRFCAIEGTQCQKSIPYKGKDTFFFAYPSGPRWQAFSSDLVEELGQRGFYGERWEDLVKNDLLFSKVCDGIYGHDYLLAEVSDPNPNVLLEIGYALAVGRMPILLQDKNWEDWSRNLLTTLESCHYETREDIHRYVGTLQSRSSDIPVQPDRRLPFLEHMGIFDYQETPGTVYHLKPKLSADWISRVDRTLKKGVFRLGTMDPSDSVSDEFYPQARQIQRASLIVASLLSTKYVDSEQHNANVSLLIGFAIGLGKQVLVLQHQPSAPILDLGSVSRPVDSEGQVEEIVDSWIDVQVRLSLSRTEHANRQVATRQKADRIRSIYLGHPDALQDDQLLDYFVHTKEFDDAIDGRRSIFIGRRGSGKSANFQAIRAEIEDKTNIVLVEIAPDDFELERISGYLDTECELANPKLVFQHIWNHVLTSEILKSLAEGTDRLYYSPDDQIRDRLRQSYDDNYDLLRLDFGSRVIEVLRKVIRTAPEITPEERQAAAEGSIRQLRNYELGRDLREFARRERIKFFIVADDLDKHWRPDTRQSIDLLVGLIAESDRLQRYFETQIQIVLFLREDIYDVLTQFDDDLPKRNFIRMEWTKSNLKHLVAERLAATAGETNENDDETWSVIFPAPVEGRPASDYILSRSLPRPRDVLDLCQKAVDQAQRNGHTFVTAEDVLDGERHFSDALFWSVASEFRGLYPSLEHILIEFGSLAERIPWDEFKTVASNAVNKNPEVVAKWVRSGNIDADSLADILFTVGVIGLSRVWESDPRFCNGRSFSETWGLVSPNPVVHIHPAFRHTLDVSGTALKPSWRPRGRRRIDSRQLSFGDPR